MNDKEMSTQVIYSNKHGGDLETARKQFGRKRFLDLSVSINPWGPPFKLWLTLIGNLSILKEYPQPYTTNGREVLARFFGIEAEQVVLGNGAAELIRHLPLALPVKRAIVFEPTFAEYGQAFSVVGKPVVKIVLNSQFEVPLDKIAEFLQAGDLVFICQPNNPTGGLFKEKDLLRLLDLIQAKQGWLAIDESFLWFSGETQRLSFYRYLKDYPNLLIINSLTKIGAIPGLRLGFVMTGSETANLIRNSLDQWNVNRFAQKVLPTILNSDFLKITLRKIKQENIWLQEQLKLIPGLKVFPWDANFYLVKSEASGFQMGELIHCLGAEGILVRDCSNFDGLGPEYFRVAVGDRGRNKFFLKKLRGLMKT
jgi:threonine-phosphate decarboxylase